MKKTFLGSPSTVRELGRLLKEVPDDTRILLSEDEMMIPDAQPVWKVVLVEHDDERALVIM